MPVIDNLEGKMYSGMDCYVDVSYSQLSLNVKAKNKVRIEALIEQEKFPVTVKIYKSKDASDFQTIDESIGFYEKNLIDSHIFKKSDMNKVFEVDTKNMAYILMVFKTIDTYQTGYTSSYLKITIL